MSDVPADELRRRVGHRICAARKAAGLTQHELAQRFGYTATAVSYWESGYREPSLDVLVGMAKALCVSLSWLFDIDGSDDPYELAYRRGWNDCAAVISAALVARPEMEPVR